MNATGKKMLWGPLAVALVMSGVSGAVGQVTPPQEAARPATRQDVDALVLQAKQALEQGDLQSADRLTAQAESAGVRYPLFHRGDTPSRLRRLVEQAKRHAPKPDPFLQASSGPANPFVPAATAQAPAAQPQPLPTVGPSDATPLPSTRYRVDSSVMNATAETPVGAPRYGQQALHVPEQDTTTVEPATSLVGPAGGPRLAQSNTRSRYDNPSEPAMLSPAPSETPTASSLMAQGEQALRTGDLTGAWRQFQLANDRRGELSPLEQSRLDSHLKVLTTAPVNAAPGQLPPPPSASAASSGSSMFESADEAQRVLMRQLSSDVGNRKLEAREIRESDPKRALELLKSMQQEVESAQLTDDFRGLLLRRVDAEIANTEKYISDNRAQIELDERNAAVLAEVERGQATRLKLQQKKAELVDKFNVLRDEQRYAEAELVAKQLYEMMPEDEVALVLWQNAKFLRREVMNRQMRAAREEGTYRMLTENDAAATPNVFDREEMVFGPDWETYAKNRKSLGDANSRKTERDILIEQKLKTPVQLKYQDVPLSQVIEELSQMTGVNIHLDPRGMSQEGVSTDTPVSLDLNQEVMLKSALNLILEPLHLSYLVKDEVLKITSEQLRDGEVYPVTYYVADLVTPIPNFVPSNNIGLQGMINDAYSALGYGGGGLGAPGPVAMVGGRTPGALGDPNRNVLAQNLSGPQFGGGGGGNVPLGGGPSAGGGANADFDSLIDLIISTVASETWAENGGGEAEIRPYVNNLSLVVSQTQAVHEEIADLLEQLRRLQDLQITIEVRFIRLNDSFFERIGIDFDVNINDKTVGNDDLLAGGSFETPRNSQTVGVVQQAAGDLPVFSSDLDIPFRQGSFAAAVPQFGGFDPGQAASFGFAILSDIEAYFLVNAAQGDQRTNVLNAPKVTLFNGQTAFVADASQTPFVISVIPVVGEFAAAQQPVIVVLSEGTMMNIQAVVSEDRRYVRLTVVPFFSEIGDVQEFTFEGETSTDTSTSATDADDDGTNESDAGSTAEVRSGTTVQLPTFQFVSVSTTVSVPDGGTVLLGGIKRLNEGRNENGVPLLSKLPYINRLFRNVGIGRETDSLMMMVTPRIIIQEEEEQRLGIAGN